MRKILSLILPVLMITTLSSCSDDDNNEPSVSFKRPVYILQSAAAVEVEIGLTSPAPTDLTIPFTISGSAIKGEDYTISAEEFEIKSGETSASVLINPFNNTQQGREIRLQLTQVKGYSFGFYDVVVIPVQPRSVLTASFDNETYSLATETEVSLSLKNGTSKYTKPSSTVTVPFDFDAATTAVPGTHFEIVGGEQVLTMTSKDAVAKVKFRFLKKETGKDKIVIRIHENELFEAGTNNRATINIESTTGVNDIVGTWLCEGLSNRDQLIEAANTQGFGGDADNVPSNCPTTDEIRFTLNSNGGLDMDISGITGDLTRYLRNTTLTFLSEADETLYEIEGEQTASVATLQAAKVNIPFSANAINEGQAPIGARVLDNGETLELRIFRYEPVDFLTRVYAYRASSVAFAKEPMKQDFTLVYRFKKH